MNSEKNVKENTFPIQNQALLRSTFEQIEDDTTPVLKMSVITMKNNDYELAVKNSSDLFFMFSIAKTSSAQESKEMLKS